MESVIETGAAHGYNGLVLSAGLDRMDLFDEPALNRLRAIKQMCDTNSIELIPLIFSLGYGSSVLKHDRNLAAGYPVKDAEFVVKGMRARHVPSHKEPLIPNGGFEEYEGNRAAGFGLQDLPGEVSFIDTNVFHSGKASMRFQDISKDPHGHGRVRQRIRVKPYHCYKATMWVKTENMKANQLTMYPLSEKGKYLLFWGSPPETNSDWTKMEFMFNSWEFDLVKIFAGCWRGTEGRFWLDDLQVEEVGMRNVIRRPGAPLVVKNAATGEVYEEGRDFKPVENRGGGFGFGNPDQDIEVIPGGLIKDGDRLLVDYYYFSYVNNKQQVPVCPAEEKLYEIWAEQIRRLHDFLAPRYYFLDMDEIRAGGSCAACHRIKEKEGWSQGRLLGHAITRACDIVKDVNPDAEVIIWSDMLDPHHNARADYYVVDGDYTGSWEHVPEHLVIACWSGSENTLKHFTGRGHKVLAAGYYDSDNLQGSRTWLERLDRFPEHSVGIMYTTWLNKFGLLADFGDMVMEHRVYTPRAAD
ncbi:carbohydrate binding domain-containing protein [Verrucomicrobiota bacterium]